MNSMRLELRQSKPSTHEAILAFTEWLTTVPELNIGKDAKDNSKLQQLVEQFLHENCLTDLPLDFDAISSAIQQMENVPFSKEVKEQYHCNGYTVEKHHNENGMDFLTITKDGEKLLQPVYIEYKIDNTFFGEVYGEKIVLNLKSKSLMMLQSDTVVLTHYFLVHVEDHGYELVAPRFSKVPEESNESLRKECFIGSILF